MHATKNTPVQRRGLVAALFGNFVGLAIGLVAGYFGGRTESVIMRVMDVWSALPGMMLCILAKPALPSNS